MNSLQKIYSQLIALRENLPQEKSIHCRYVNDYHRLLDALSKEVGESDLSDFRIDSSQFYYTASIGSTMIGDKHCDRAYLLTKLDAILIFFSPTEDKPSIGFHYSTN